MNTRRKGVRSAIVTEEAQINGPEIDYRAPDCTPAPAISMGSFRTKTLEHEFDLCSWCVNYRLAAIAEMPGYINTHKLIFVARWARHYELYGFPSLKARREKFMDHEALNLDESSWISKIIQYSLHAVR